MCATLARIALCNQRRLESMQEDQEVCGAAASNEILVWVHNKAKYVLKHRNMVEAILQQFVSHGFSFGLGCDFSKSVLEWGTGK